MGVNTAVAKEGRTAEAIGHAVLRAKYPNVSVKLSIAECVAGARPVQRPDPDIQRLFDAYEPKRRYWGTDATTGVPRVSRKQRLTDFTEEPKFLSESDKDWRLGRAIQERFDGVSKAIEERRGCCSA